MKAESIVPNGVYVDASLTRWRRVIAINPWQGEQFVVYSVGTDVNRWCRLTTFCRWAKKRITVDADGLIEEMIDEERDDETVSVDSVVPERRGDRDDGTSA